MTRRELLKVLFAGAAGGMAAKAAALADGLYPAGSAIKVDVMRCMWTFPFDAAKLAGWTWQEPGAAIFSVRMNFNVDSPYRELQEFVENTSLQLEADGQHIGGLPSSFLEIGSAAVNAGDEPIELCHPVVFRDSARVWLDGPKGWTPPKGVSGNIIVDGWKYMGEVSR